MERRTALGAHLFNGCCHEAQRCDGVTAQLAGFHTMLLDPAHAPISPAGRASFHDLADTLNKMLSTSGLLRELADLGQVHMDRAPIALDHLNVVLPCLARSLRDMTAFATDRARSRRERWGKMRHDMTEEANGMTLPQRFVLYNHFLVALQYMLTRSPSFDFNALEVMRERLLDLRELRGIGPPTNAVGALVRREAYSVPPVDPTMHWAQQIFSLPLTSRTALRGHHESITFGPHRVWGDLRIPGNSQILFRRPFDHDQISLIVYLDGRDHLPYLLLRTFFRGLPWFSIRGAHELCIDREAGALQFRQWNPLEHHATLWAALYFMTWEEMVLIHCTFMALKARNRMTVRISDIEYRIPGEHRLFQARIRDDGFMHLLIVYRDRGVRGIRLHAAVWEGELRQCPIWTAFVTHQAKSPTWVQSVSRYRVRLADVRLYVFCEQYSEHSQRRGPARAFEIEFDNDEACDRFKDLFRDMSLELPVEADSTA